MKVDGVSGTPIDDSPLQRVVLTSWRSFSKLDAVWNWGSGQEAFSPGSFSPPFETFV
jgi:hypothetical protein